jgi:hypothetical protein
MARHRDYISNTQVRWRRLRLPWSALFAATLLALCAYWLWRAGIRPSPRSWDLGLPSDSGVAGTLVGLVLLMVFGRRMRSPRPVVLGAAKPFPGGGYLRWSGGLVLAAGLLLVAAGAQQPAQNQSQPWLQPIRSPVAAAAVAAAALLLALYSVPRLRLCYLGRRPGPVEIPLVDNATLSDDVPAKELTLQLRRDLATVRLYPPSLIPGNAPPQEFVALVQSATSNPRNLLGTLAGPLTVLPSHAYRVHASLLQRDQPEAPYGVSVQGCCGRAGCRNRASAGQRRGNLRCSRRLMRWPRRSCRGHAGAARHPEPTG